MKTILLLSALTLGTFFFTEEQPKRQTIETATKIDFTFDLFRTLAAAKPDDNITVSPYGAERLLDFVRSGSAGETKTQIDAVLGDTVLGGAVSDGPEPGGPLTTAAALWTQQGHPILPEFLKTAREKFGASVEQADFTGNAAEAVERINAWCSEKTNGKIPALFDKLGETTRCVLAGAVHFAADWKTPFDKNATTDAPFTLPDGTTTSTKLMMQTGRMKYAETDETLAVELPYKNDGYSMLLLLPKDATAFAQWESGMTAGKWNDLRAGMKPERVDLRMPRFTSESELVLNEPLQKLGMPAAFSRDADFSKIDGRTDLYLSEVRQKTFIQVDETGTEAAAATGAAISVKSARLDIKPFYADRPFLYAIVGPNTLEGQTVLFLGRFIKPEQQPERSDGVLTEMPEEEAKPTEEANPETPSMPFADPGLSGEGGAFN